MGGRSMTSLRAQITRFGGLPRLFAGATHPGLVFVDTPEELANAAAWLCQMRLPGTRALVEPYAWERVADDLLRAAFDTPRERGIRALLRTGDVL